MDEEKRKVFEAGVSEVRRVIGHGTDGPITAFVLISRATHLMCELGTAQPGLAPSIGASSMVEKSHGVPREHPEFANIVAEALYEELDSYGWVDKDAKIETGS